MTAGRTATRTGNTMELAISDLFRNLGFTERFDREQAWDDFGKQAPCTPCFVRQVRATGLRGPYGEVPRFDFLVLGAACSPGGLVIECKWQQASGTAQEKLPYAVLRINQLKIPAFLLVDGEGFSPGAKQWAKAQGGAGEGCLLGALSLTEFMAEANRDRFNPIAPVQPPTAQASGIRLRP